MTGAEMAGASRAAVETAFQGWHSQSLRSAQLRKEEEEMRIMNATRIEAWLTKRREQFAIVKPKKDLKVLVARNMGCRGPLKLAKRPQADRTPKLHSCSYYSTMEDSASPYMSPSPIWTKIPSSARQSRRLPPLSPHSMSTTDPEAFGDALPLTPTSKSTRPKTEDKTSRPKAGSISSRGAGWKQSKGNQGNNLPPVPFADGFVSGDVLRETANSCGFGLNLPLVQTTINASLADDGDRNDEIMNLTASIHEMPGSVQNKLCMATGSLTTSDRFEQVW